MTALYWLAGIAAAVLFGFWLRNLSPQDDFVSTEWLGENIRERGIRQQV